MGEGTCRPAVLKGIRGERVKEEERRSSTHEVKERE
jgi:hypothetical protein